MAKKIIDAILSLPPHDWFGEQVIYDLSVMELDNPLDFDEINENINLLINYIGERSPLTEDSIRSKIIQISEIVNK